MKGSDPPRPRVLRRALLRHRTARRWADEWGPRREEAQCRVRVAGRELGRVGEDVELVGDRQLGEGSQLRAGERGAVTRDAVDVDRLRREEGRVAGRAIAGAVAV